ncbi:MAG: pentapeptide repeat-containing protein [Leptolyngbyaceae bacterium]|nr:pentapeptide repeat-containing protein [Leptolyngbyaceae bacterium]
MANPTVGKGSNPFSQTLPLRSRLPLLTRRWGAWAIEVTLVAASALVPYSLGLQAKAHFAGEPVPLNAWLATVEEVGAKTLGIPLGESNRTVAPLTNLFWSAALVTPLLVGGFNLYLLGKTGKTLPKRWLGVRVITENGSPPGLARAIFREGVGRWGVPLGTTYLIWRYSGAFPDLSILVGLSGLALLAGGISAQINGQRRGLHDLLAGTVVVDAIQPLRPHPGRFQPIRSQRHEQSRLERSPNWTDEDAAIAALILTPEPKWETPGIWAWMREHPGLTLLIVSLSSMAMVLGTFVGTQVYIQSQANQREFKQQDNEVFLALVSKLSSTVSNASDERQSAILALGTVKDDRAVPFLVDWLSQETLPLLIEATQQALVSRGTESLPYLRRLNQSLRNDLASLRHNNNLQDRMLLTLRQQATQRAIAKLLTLYSGQVHGIDLNRLDLGKSISDSAQFTLVLDQTDLSGMQFRGTILANASLRGSRFYGPGEDNRWSTFDDWIADLSGADLKDADLTGAILTNVSLYRTHLVRATLSRANLSSARLSEANLGSAKLIEADLRQATLEKASLTGADLSDANLTQANLQSTRFTQATAIGTQMLFANLTASDWKGADLSGANLSQANLQKASFSGARLAGANLSNAQVQGVNFQNADLKSVDLRGSTLDGANFQGAIFTTVAAIASDQFIRPVPVPNQTTLLRGVDFTKAKNLSASQLAYLCAQGALHPKCP